MLLPCRITGSTNAMSTFLCRFAACIHFAGKKAVGESVQLPLMYYQNNVTGSTNLLKAMAAHGCKRVSYKDTTSTSLFWLFAWQAALFRTSVGSSNAGR